MSLDRLDQIILDYIDRLDWLELIGLDLIRSIEILYIYR